ncbi:MAG: HD domain-containing phosphohydrolase, partial [Candidatus Omnitrophota bacterium]
MDGSGYPDELIGKAIPFGARVLAVLDTFDAMTDYAMTESSSGSPRAYEIKKYTVEEALKYIEDESGKLFDPRVVEALIAVQRDDKRQAERKIDEPLLSSNANIGEVALPANIKDDIDLREYLKDAHQIQICGERVDGIEFSEEYSAILRDLVAGLPSDIKIILVQHNKGSPDSAEKRLLFFDESKGEPRWIFSHAGTRNNTGKFIYLPKQAFEEISRTEEGRKFLAKLIVYETKHFDEIGRTQLSSALPRTFRPRSLRSGVYTERDEVPRNDIIELKDFVKGYLGYRLYPKPIRQMIHKIDSMTAEIKRLSSVIGDIDKLLEKIRKLKTKEERELGAPEVVKLMEELENKLKRSERFEKRKALEIISSLKQEIASGRFENVLSRLGRGKDGARALLNRYLGIVFERRTRLEIWLREKNVYLPMQEWRREPDAWNFSTRFARSKNIAETEITSPEFYWAAKVPTIVRKYIAQLISQGSLGSDILGARGAVRIDYAGNGTSDDWFLNVGLDDLSRDPSTGKHKYGPMPSPNLFFRELSGFSGETANHFRKLWYEGDRNKRNKNRRQLISMYHNYRKTDILRGYVWNRDKQVYAISWSDQEGNRHNEKWMLIKDILRNEPAAFIKEAQEATAPKLASGETINTEAILRNTFQEEYETLFLEEGPVKAAYNISKVYYQDKKDERGIDLIVNNIMFARKIADIASIHISGLLSRKTRLKLIAASMVFGIPYKNLRHSRLDKDIILLASKINDIDKGISGLGLEKDNAIIDKIKRMIKDRIDTPEELLLYLALKTNQLDMSSTIGTDMYMEMIYVVSAIASDYGLTELAIEINNRALMHYDPGMYKWVKDIIDKKIGMQEESASEYMNELSTRLETVLRQKMQEAGPEGVNPLDVKIIPRKGPKDFVSVILKMLEKMGDRGAIFNIRNPSNIFSRIRSGEFRDIVDESFDTIVDIIGMRIIVPGDNDRACYYVESILRGIFREPGFFYAQELLEEYDDYIAKSPKANYMVPPYKGIHMTIARQVARKKVNIEIQIRTGYMDRLSHGVLSDSARKARKAGLKASYMNGYNPDIGVDLTKNINEIKKQLREGTMEHKGNLALIFVNAGNNRFIVELPKSAKGPTPVDVVCHRKFNYSDILNFGDIALIRMGEKRNIGPGVRLETGDEIEIKTKGTKPDRSINQAEKERLKEYVRYATTHRAMLICKYPTDSLLKDAARSGRVKLNKIGINLKSRDTMADLASIARRIYGFSEEAWQDELAAAVEGGIIEVTEIRANLREVQALISALNKPRPLASGETIKPASGFIEGAKRIFRSLTDSQDFEAHLDALSKALKENDKESALVELDYFRRSGNRQILKGLLEILFDEKIDSAMHNSEIIEIASLIDYIRNKEGLKEQEQKETEQVLRLETAPIENYHPYFFDEEDGIYYQFNNLVIPNLHKDFSQDIAKGGKIKGQTPGGVSFYRDGAEFFGGHQAAMLLMESGIGPENIEIVVNHRNNPGLKQGEKGFYGIDWFIKGERPLTENDKLRVKRHFDLTNDGRLRVKPQIRKAIRTISKRSYNLAFKPGFHFILYNFVEYRLEYQQGSDELLKSNLVAGAIINNLMEGGYLVTTAEKWFSDDEALYPSVGIPPVTAYGFLGDRPLTGRARVYKKSDSTIDEKWLDSYFENELKETVRYKMKEYTKELKILDA